MGLLIDCAFAALIALAVCRVLRTRPAGPAAILFVFGLVVAMIVATTWVMAALQPLGFGQPAALALLCIVGPLMEEVTRKAFRKPLPDGSMTVLPISLVLGGVEAVVKALRVNLVLAPDYAALDTLAVYALLMSLTSILFHANMGLLWDRRAGRHGGAQATYECILLHGSFNMVVIFSEPPTLPGKVVQIAVVIALHLVCFVALAAARPARTRAPPGAAERDRGVSGDPA